AFHQDFLRFLRRNMESPTAMRCLRFGKLDSASFDPMNLCMNWLMDSPLWGSGISPCRRPSEIRPSRRLRRYWRTHSCGRRGHEPEGDGSSHKGRRPDRTRACPGLRDRKADYGAEKDARKDAGKQP